MSIVKEAASKEELDQYSRQIFTLGLDAMQKLSESSALITGINGLGAEIAKNVILSGVKVVTLHDSFNTTMQDLTTNFYLTEADIGKNRATASLSKFTELNQYVHVDVVEGALSAETIKKYKVAVFVNTPHQELLRLSEICRANKVKFICCDFNGVFSRAFVDVGVDHIITDPDGERPKTGAVNLITNENPVVVDTIDEEMHGLSDGEFVTFTGIEGMTELNDREPLPVKFISLSTFSVEIDGTKMSEYRRNGYFTQVKMKTTLTHTPYNEAYKKPEILCEVDLMHFDRPMTVHSCYIALSQFQEKNKRLPRPYNDQDTKEFVGLATAIHEEIFPDTEFDEKIADIFGKTASGSLAPISCTMGGIVGQEVVKAVTNKLTPLTQWLYLDHSELLSTGFPTEADVQPLNCRYDGQIAILGRQFQEKLKKQRCFVVGAGAIGCEALKNLALMGVGCGEGGLITVTDMDNIEISNLSRQFLFRTADIQKPKSECAANAIKGINPAANLRSLTIKVGTETEDIFNNDFWNSLDFVVNALDNVQSRRYVDDRCVGFGKALLDSGTLGTQGNTQSIVPFVTENYGATHDPPEKSIPLCTLRNMPYLIDHTIEYARGLFMELFTEQPADAQQFLRDKEKYKRRLMSSAATRTSTINALRKNVDTDLPKTYDDCIRWARLEFERLFANQIKQLLCNFPPDALTSLGTPFWSGKNKLPTPAVFDVNDELHLQFVGYASYLRAHNYHIPIGTDIDWERVKAISTSTPIPVFVPSTGIRIEIAGPDEKNPEPAEEQEQAGTDEEFEVIWESLPKKTEGIQIEPEEFEKDDDTNHHIDFIYTVADLRAINYSIPTVDRNQVKMISGKIIPAIATTTGVVSGLAELDVLKVVRGEKDIDNYRNWFINLAINLYNFSAPGEAKPIAEGSAFTVWDKFTFVFDHIPTIQELVDYIRTEKKVEASMIGYGTGIILMTFWPEAKVKERMAMPLTQAIEAITKKPLEDDVNSVTLTFTCNDLEDEDKDIDIPPVEVRFERR
ncbi:putative Ubiquitin-activating enzyme E1 1 [Blattamonas nauphoetae]|uniref:E1 ubiquitin-activating enzyme n=1 Tax=Blattamonas nauphoetae TaxID=2049346 RepID=A0ABQ9XH80_9EUKA|nr:putative Ubiquitin-activating enzyme E1 1 [Blattamonas nauphoetae]